MIAFAKPPESLVVLVPLGTANLQEFESAQEIKAFLMEVGISDELAAGIADNLWRKIGKPEE